MNETLESKNTGTNNWSCCRFCWITGEFKRVFERRTSIESETFFLFIRLDANKFVSLSFFPVIKTVYLIVSTKPLLNDAKSPLPVDVHRSKTLLLISLLPLLYLIHDSTRKSSTTCSIRFVNHSELPVDGLLKDGALGLIPLHSLPSSILGSTGFCASEPGCFTVFTL